MRKGPSKRFIKPFAIAIAVSGVTVAAIALVVPPPADLGVDIADVPYYQLPFGDNPFYPSNIKTTDGRFADPHNIPSAADCVQCHVDEFEEWAASLHAVSGRDKIYDLTIDYNEHFKGASQGPEMIRFCEACHEPAEVTLGRTNRIVSVMPSDAETEGLNCVFCHSAVAADPEAGNGALTVAVNEAKDHLKNTMLMASPRDHARAFGAKATKSLLTESAFCGACHTEAYFPDVSEVEGRVPVQTTYQEWKQSWYAKNDVTCQDCHMNPAPVEFINALKKDIVEKPTRHTHTFVGANYVMVETDLESNLFYLRGGVLSGLTGERYLEIIERQKELTHRFLRSAAELDIRTAGFGPDGQGDFQIAVKNVGAGHNLPTGVSDQKYMWLELELTDATGNQIYHSGWFDSDKGQTDPDAVTWIERFFDAKGNRIKDHLTFNTAFIDFQRPLIPPRGEDVVRYTVPLTEDLKGPVTVKAKLWYRVALQELIYNVVKTTLIVPPFLLAEVEQTIELEAIPASQ